MSGRVVVVGSINTDYVVAAARLPQPGETVLGGRLGIHPGGKGANQAVAAARAGAEVALIGAVGSDTAGDEAVAALAAEGIDVSRVRRVGGPTGAAIIAVGPRGENQIVVAPGANLEVTEADAAVAAEVAGTDGIVVTGLEIPMAAVIAATIGAAAHRMRAIVNPAPAHALPGELLAAHPILTPNEHELIVAIGNDDPAAALEELARRTGAPVIVTQGPAGALLADGEDRVRFEGQQVSAVVDTTGAGDTFIGALAAWLAGGASLPEAIRAANAAAGLSVGSAGARAGMPRRAEIDALIGLPSS